VIHESAVRYAAAHLPCSANSPEPIKQALEQCFRTLNDPQTPLTYAWNGAWVAQVNSFVHNQPICIACSVHQLQTETAEVSYVILFRHVAGDIACCSMLCDKVKYQFCQSEDTDRAALLQRELADWWGADNTELYAGSLTVGKEQMQSYMEFATAYNLHVAMRIDAARSLASSCATHPNRQQFVECGGADTLEDLFSVGTALEIQQCAVSVLFECLKDQELTEDLRRTLRAIGTNGSRVKQSLQELASVEQGAAVDPRAGQCLELLMR
jgi:hypothetical protein